MNKLKKSPVIGAFYAVAVAVFGVLVFLGISVFQHTSDASQTVDEMSWTSVVAAVNSMPLIGVTPSLGGSLLAAGACSTATTTITGATTTMVADATPASATNIGDGAFWKAYVSATNVVTVKVCQAILGTPTAVTYNVRVIQ